MKRAASRGDDAGPGATLRARIEGISDLLSDIHRNELRISSLLHEFGFSEVLIDQVRRQHAEAIAGLLLTALRDHLADTPRQRQLFEIIERRYGLVSGKRETLGSVGRSMGIGRERVRQLQERTLKRWRRQRHLWQDAFHDAARDFLWAQSSPDVPDERASV